ncbi:CPBP family intramembrane metalloprotease [Clostridium botulinum]|nr:CPBP family intramembrane metalloprotease [Clostridium botulinum]
MKYLKMIGKIFLYFILYTVVQIVTGAIFSIVYLLKNGITKSKTDIAGVILNNAFLITAIAAVLTFIIYILIFKLQTKNLFEICKFKKINFKVSLTTLVASFGLSLFSCSLVILLQDKFPSYKQTAESISQGATSILGLVSMILIIPMFEEILFRGLIFNELKKNINIILAVIIQALIFALAHGNMLQGIYTLILGIIIAIVYIKTNSIITCMLFHISYNLLGSIIVPYILYMTGKYYIGFTILGVILLIISLTSLLKNNVEIKTNNDFNVNI